MTAGAPLPSSPEAPAIRLRPATEDDRDRVLAWNGDPGVRARSLDPRPIAPEEHARWFSERLADPLTRMAIVLCGDEPVGVVRIERRRARAPGRISIALARDARGRGLGRAAIVAACAADGGEVIAEIVVDNLISRACFQAAGFRPLPAALTTQIQAVLGPDRLGVRRYLWSPPMTQTEASDRAPETAQLALWRSEFGARYTDRNDVENPARQTTWRGLMAGLGVERALEVGCNVGWNLRYLRACGVEAWGVEPQPYAIERARRTDPGLTIVPGTAFALPFQDGWFDLAFTSGVLIHIGPADLGRAIDELYRVTRRWLLVIEYDHHHELAVPYRGQREALWKRDHGAAIATRHPDLVLARRGFLAAADGYDDCTYHLFEKQP